MSSLTNQGSAIWNGHIWKNDTDERNKQWNQNYYKNHHKSIFPVKEKNQKLNPPHFQNFVIV